MVRLITRVDIKNNFLVKGVHLEGLRTLGPIELFTKYYSEENVDEILLTDCVASLFNRNNLVKYIEIATKELHVPITVSGGIININGNVKNVTQVLKKIGFEKFSLISYGKNKICSHIIKNNIYAFQFHLERSGDLGAEYLKKF